jgi:hypothetical protein
MLIFTFKNMFARARAEVQACTEQKIHGNTTSLGFVTAYSMVMKLYLLS